MLKQLTKIADVYNCNYRVVDNVACLYNTPVGIVNVTKDSAYFLEISKAADKRKPFPTFEEKNVSFSTTLKLEEDECKADNVLALRKFAKNLNLGSLVSGSELSRDQTSWNHFLKKTRIVPYGLGLAYKTVTENMSSFHDKSFYYSIGRVEEIQEARKYEGHCNVGLHLGTYKEASSFSKGENCKLLAVLYNPKDVLSVSNEKIRCVRVLPVAILNNESELFSMLVQTKYLKKLT